MALTFEVAAKTDAGCVRANNEDSFDFDTAAGIFVVCDGMGGHAAGEVASGIAVRTVVDYFRSSPEDDTAHNRSEADLANAITLANERIRKSAARTPGQAGMGSTIAAALWNGEFLSIAHVGDSRVYLIRDNQINLLTDDHSLVMQGVRSGLITPEEAERSGAQNIILRALGAEDTVESDLTRIVVTPDDVFLITTDGLTRHVADSEILELVQSASTMDDACRMLIEKAKSDGGSDNVTCLLARAVVSEH